MSAEPLNLDHVALLVIDVQEKLLPAIPTRDALVRNIEFLLDAAAMVNLKVFATEQYPKGLGPTIAPLAAKLPSHRPSKTTFSCVGSKELMKALGMETVIVVGMETHVCVAQTVEDLLEREYNVTVVADAVASRFAFDHDVALMGMRDLGAFVTSTEAIAFEWFGGSHHPRFKDFSALVQARARALRGPA